jgi:hypothetical protein
MATLTKTYDKKTNSDVGVGAGIKKSTISYTINSTTITPFSTVNSITATFTNSAGKGVTGTLTKS